MAIPILMRIDWKITSMKLHPRKRKGCRIARHASKKKEQNRKKKEKKKQVH